MVARRGRQNPTMKLRQVETQRVKSSRGWRRATTCSTTALSSSRAGSGTHCQQQRRPHLAAAARRRLLRLNDGRAQRLIYRKVSSGGRVVIDDYGNIEPCRAAVTDYRRTNGIDDELIDIDGFGVYWRRP